MVAKTAIWVRTSLLDKQKKSAEVGQDATKSSATNSNGNGNGSGKSGASRGGPLQSPLSPTPAAASAAIGFRGIVMSPSTAKKERFTRSRLNSSLSSASIDLDRSGGAFSWVRCQIMSGDLARYETEGLTVRVAEPTSSYFDEVLVLSSALFAKPKPRPPYSSSSSGGKAGDRQELPILMANEWSAKEVEALSAVSSSASNAGKDKRSRDKSPTPSKSSKSSVGSPKRTKSSSTAGSSSTSSKSKTKAKRIVLPPDDLITLTHLHEPAVVCALERRYQSDIIYTATGPILLALNPFKRIPRLYDESVMNEYWMHSEKVKGGKSSKTAGNSSSSSKKRAFQNKDGTMRPHIFQSSHRAFRSMMQAIDTQRQNEMVDAQHKNSEAVTATASPIKGKNKAGSTAEESNDDTSASGTFVQVNQSLLVSGESGAGKTVTTKHAMKYLASLSHRKAEFEKKRRKRREASPGRRELPRTNSGDLVDLNSSLHASMERRRQSSTSRPGLSTSKETSKAGGNSRGHSWKAGAMIEERILESNPILESFGNARTVRNDNSSRFGKFIELQFKESGSIIGANIDTYLLEKVRLVHLMEGERNFHIFYEFLEGTTEPSDRQTYQLNNFTAKDFKLTNGSGTFDRRDGANDAELFDELVFAMGTMGFDPQMQQDLFACIAAFLHASNLTFLALTEDSSSIDASNPHLAVVLDLLGLDKDMFNAAMTEYEIDVGNSSYTRRLNAEGAHKTLEAFIKAAYGAMFSFIVQTVNKKIDFRPKPGTHIHKSERKAASISVLDIFGFESFQVNSFEQLCINYCNEALQQQFNTFIFKTEQEEYQREGVAWEFIEFPDNQDVIDLIDGKVGVLSILTDTCRTPRGTDKSFVDSMYKQVEVHSRFLGKALHKGKKQFIVDHYAGPVLYYCDGFVEKNKDETPRGAATMLESSSKSFVQLLGKIIESSSESGVAGGSSNNRGAGGGVDIPGRMSKKKKRPTVGGQFSSQLKNLRRRIESSTPHYIRCLKPNQTLEPAKYEHAMVADQLRYAGVLEAIRVSRAGYSQRYMRQDFLQRYRFIALKQVASAADDRKIDTLVRKVALKIWKSKNRKKDPPENCEAAVGIQTGKSKVFLRQFAFEYLEKYRTDQLNKASTVLQRIARGYLVRSERERDLRRIIVVQSCVRRHFACKIMIHHRRVKAAIRIQSKARQSKARSLFQKYKILAITAQRFARGRRDRAVYEAMHEAHLKEQEAKQLAFSSAVVIQSTFRRFIAQAKFKNTVMEKQRESSKLQGEALSVAIRSDKAAAVARETVKAKTKEVGDLNDRLATAESTADRAAVAEEQAEDLRKELESARNAMRMLQERLKESEAYAATLHSENKKLKKKLDSSSSNGRNGKKSRYRDHPDLEQLNANLLSMVSQSEQSKTATDALVESLKILL